MESCSSDNYLPSSSSSSSLSSDVGVNTTSISNSRRYGLNIAASNLIHAPLTTLLEYSGILGGGGGRGGATGSPPSSPPSSSRGFNRGGGGGDDHHQEVTIRIISGGGGGGNGGGVESSTSALLNDQPGGGEVLPETLASDGAVAGGTTDASSSNSSSYQRYDIQNIARWIEQILPFSLLLLLVFIRQHLQGFCVTLWIAAVLFKSNDVLRKQTALKGERKNYVLVTMTVLFMLHVVSIYWWYLNDDLLYPLALLPPTKVPPFWHAVFIIVVNDAMARQVAMAFKCILLLYYKNSRGQNYRKQGQMLTLMEYFLLLYRALLPAPVWYRFFLNKEYGSLFSSLITGLYLTFKLTSVLRKVQLFFTALRALSRKEMHYGSYATSEQVYTSMARCNMVLKV
ncbi:uncharacterized protein LOC126667870 isoform X2 [Mercurialis annua]|uniref:uncharacterized protein LOC126667870 isoform X2 n=1 Tax=Mercurialis annua TaxID=3986 RepID=UPI00215F3A87|nr:uncharacterized protein LOC126667870 isoform X2 [Mercurialis annua]